MLHDEDGAIIFFKKSFFPFSSFFIFPSIP
jgi:hypothetical protein